MGVGLAGVGFGAACDVQDERCRRCCEVRSAPLPTNNSKPGRTRCGYQCGYQPNIRPEINSQPAVYIVIFSNYLAEREGFEPSIRFLTIYALSRGAPSTTRPSLQSSVFYNSAILPHCAMLCRLIETKSFVQHTHPQFHVLFINDNRYLDLGGRDHEDIDPLFR